MEDFHYKVMLALVENIPDMSSGQGYFLKYQGDGKELFMNFLLSQVTAACPQIQWSVLTSTCNPK